LEHSAIGAPGDMERRLRDHASDGALQDQLLSLPCSWSEYLRYATASFHANRRDILSAFVLLTLRAGGDRFSQLVRNGLPVKTGSFRLAAGIRPGSDLEWMVGC